MTFKTYKIYIVLIVSLFIIRASPFSIGASWLDEAINDFAVGGIASTVVAWLIFLEEDNRKQKKSEIIAFLLYKPLVLAICDYMQLFCEACALMPSHQRSKRQNFHYWNEDYLANFKCDIRDENISEITLDDLLSKQDRIIDESNNILSQKWWLVQEKIMCKQDFETIENIKKVFILNKFSLKGDVILHNLEIFINKLIKVLSETENFKNITTCEFSHDLQLRKYINTGEELDY